MDYFLFIGLYPYKILLDSYFMPILAFTKDLNRIAVLYTLIFGSVNIYTQSFCNG